MVRDHRTRGARRRARARRLDVDGGVGPLEVGAHDEERDLLQARARLAHGGEPRRAVGGVGAVPQLRRRGRVDPQMCRHAAQLRVVEAVDVDVGQGELAQRPADARVVPQPLEVCDADAARARHPIEHRRARRPHHGAKRRQLQRRLGPPRQPLAAAVHRERLEDLEARVGADRQQVAEARRAAPDHVLGATQPRVELVLRRDRREARHERPALGARAFHPRVALVDRVDARALGPRHVPRASLRAQIVLLDRREDATLGDKLGARLPRPRMVALRKQRVLPTRVDEATLRVEARVAARCGRHRPVRRPQDASAPLDASLGQPPRRVPHASRDGVQLQRLVQQCAVEARAPQQLVSRLHGQRVRAHHVGLDDA